MTQDEYRKYMFWLTTGVAVFILSRGVYEQLKPPKPKILINDPNRELRQRYERVMMEKEIATAEE